jgi:hypothetical protein
MRSNRRARLGSIAVVALLVACYPGDQLTFEEADVILTLYDDKEDFSTKFSYAMPDSIVHLVDEGSPIEINRDYDAAILDRVAANMGAMGYTRETDPADADLIMLVAVTAQNEIGHAGYPWGGYWGWYFPYPPSWGWGWYPWYGGTTYVYRVGTVFMQLIDPARADPSEEKVPTVWLGALNGMAEGSDIETRVLNGIDRAFAQSPYLGDGK